MTDELRARVRLAMIDHLEEPICLALRSGFEPGEVAALVAEVLPPLCDRRAAHAFIEAAYDARNSDLDRALPMDTGPFEPADADLV